MLHHEPRIGGANLDQPQILFRGEALASLRRKRRRGDRLDKQIGDLFGRCSVYLAIDADHAAVGGDGIAGQGFLIGLENGSASRRAAGIGVLDDDDGGLFKLLRQFPAGVEIDQVIEAELLALKLRCAGNAAARAVGVKRGALVRVFAVAQAAELAAS